MYNCFVCYGILLLVFAQPAYFSRITHTHTRTHTHFVWDYPGEPALERQNQNHSRLTESLKIFSK